VKLFSS